MTYTDDLKLLAVGQEDGSILLFEKDSEPRVLLDYDMNQFGEACTDLKIKSSPKGGYNKTVLAGCKYSKKKNHKTLSPRLTLKFRKLFFRFKWAHKTLGHNNRKSSVHTQGGPSFVQSQLPSQIT